MKFFLYSLTAHLSAFILFSFTISSQNEPVKPTLVFFGSILRQSELTFEGHVPQVIPAPLTFRNDTEGFIRESQSLPPPAFTEKPPLLKPTSKNRKPVLKPHLDLSAPAHKPDELQPTQTAPDSHVPMKLRLDDSN